MDKDTSLFGDKSFATIMEDIYTNSKKKDSQIKSLIDQLKSMISSLNDAALLVPLIKEYLEISVKNDDHLVKLAGIIQRLIATSGKSNTEEGFLTEAERQQLFAEAEDLLENQK